MTDFLLVLGIAAVAAFLTYLGAPAAERFDIPHRFVAAALQFAAGIITGLVALLYGLIEAPAEGWTSPTILTAFGIGIVLLGAFGAWELHTDHPMLDLRFFKNPRFSAASGSIPSPVSISFAATSR